MASCVADPKAKYSVSAADNATVACFWLSQLIASPDIVNTLPIVECLSFESFTQSASEYPKIFSPIVYIVILNQLFPLGTILTAVRCA